MAVPAYFHRDYRSLQSHIRNALRVKLDYVYVTQPSQRFDKSTLALGTSGYTYIQRFRLLYSVKAVLIHVDARRESTNFDDSYRCCQLE